MSTVALLGGSRFIGYHLLQALLREGHEVTIYNRGVTRPPVPFPNKVEVIKGDRDRPKDLERLFTKNFDAVFDISGYTSDHLEPLIKNYRSRIGHLIFCSTTAVYKDPLHCPLNESSPRTLVENTYGGNKALVENLLINIYKETNWPVTIFRPQLVFGPYDIDHPTCQLRFIFQRMIQSLPIPVKSGNKSKFNLLYVDDLVNGFISAMENNISHGKIYCIAGNNITSELDIIELSGTICAHKPDIHFISDPVYEKIEISGSWPKDDWITDNTKIKKELGLRFTSLDIAFSKTQAWFRNAPYRAGITSFRGERYLLNDLPIPRIARLYWRFMDGLKLFFIFLGRVIRTRKYKLVLIAKKKIIGFLRKKLGIYVF